jgi:hypothetical protein
MILLQAFSKRRAWQTGIHLHSGIQEAQKAGATRLRAIAEALNAHGVATARGGRWHFYRFLPLSPGSGITHLRHHQNTSHITLPPLTSQR